jgi:putative ABC transport system permease protein
MPGSGYIPGLVVPEGFTDKDNLFVPWVSVDYNFISALGIPLVAGRSFDKGNPADHLTSFILNESAVRSFGWKTAEAAIGKRMIRGDEQNGKKGVVIGVIKDFNFNPLKQPMQPMIMDVSTARLTQIAIDIQPDNIPRTISYINQKWNEAFPDRVFEYSFLDKTINDQYKDKESLSKIIEYFAFIAIFLSGLGLFSLSSFLAMQRTKEIGIRKVLGAGISTILILLSKDFILLVIIAFVISSPISWLLMNKWLQSFAYRINIPWWVFPLAGTSVVLLTVVTVCFQSMKAALMRPAQSLKNE